MINGFNEYEEDKILLSSNGLHIYCSSKKGGIQTIYPEHKSGVLFVEKLPPLVKKVLPDKNMLKKAQLKGIVVAEVEIDKSGNVVRACILEGHPELGRLTVESIMKWKYKPKKINQVPTPVRFVVKISYE